MFIFPFRTIHMSHDFRKNIITSCMHFSHKDVEQKTSANGANLNQKSIVPIPKFFCNPKMCSCTSLLHTNIAYKFNSK